MGNFPRHKVDSIHEIVFKDSRKNLVGRISISGMYTKSESWAHLKKDGSVPEEAAGPHNRHIISTLDQVTITVVGKDGEAQPPQNIQSIVDEMKANNGLVISSASNNTKKIILFEDDDFEQRFLQRLKPTGYLIEFC